jgi:thiol:disulfide interchange protein
MRRSFSTSELLGLLPDLRPGGPVVVRRVAGFALLGTSLWLVSMLALVRAFVVLFR